MSIDKYYLYYNAIGDKMKTRIKDLRIDNDFTQAQVAEKIGITQRKYSYLETEIQALTDELICRLAALYDVSADYLLKITDNPTPYK